MSFRVSPENALLGILMTGPKHGYELHAYMTTKMDQFWQLNMSQVYALLKRLENEVSVTSKQEWQENRPAKKIFTLTPRGKERFLHWVYSPVEHVRDFRIEFMAKLFFLRELQLHKRGSLIDSQIQLLQEKLRAIENSRERITDHFRGLLFSFKTAQTSAVLDWLKEYKASLSEDEKVKIG